MLVYLLDWCASHLPESLRAIEKITFRASLAAVASFVLAIVLGPRLIGWLQARFREPIKSASPVVQTLHRDKQATPTMGGIFIVAGLLASGLLFGDLANPYLIVSLVAVLGLAALGAADDLKKLLTASAGLSARAKLLGQFAVAIAVVLPVYGLHSQTPGGLDLALPLAGRSVPLGWTFIPLATLVIVASSNAVNLTDGLDGLAGGCLIFAGGAMAVVVYAAGHAEWAHYLGIAPIPGSGEMAVVAGGMIGGVLGFLWFNCHPASVFMGDTGSLPLGGLLGLLAVVARQELLLVIVGGVFVAEAVSVLGQVAYFRLRGGRRWLLCAPLHHHLQFKGWPENKIVVRFWIAAALCAILGLATLKLHANDSRPLPAEMAGGELAFDPMTDRGLDR
jgi:phospho-N-acetylmuramoyl-pentapeptide-transferase